MTLLVDGAAPWEVDDALEKFGCTTLPFEQQDQIGLDTVPAGQTETPNLVSHAIIERMVKEGRLGRKAGVGWYRYPGGGGKVIDPLIDDLISEEAHFAGISRGEISDAQIIKAIHDALSDEIAACFREGLLKTGEAATLAAEAATGFPISKTPHKDAS